MAESWGGYQASYPFPRPKVGFGVVCRCPGSGIQCLLQKRGPNSASPNKWSFPGGRLEHPGDLDDDGDVGTRRELEEECGGGSPHGLPSLIHIECYKSGKVKQTIYHVYAIDTSSNKDWEQWQPKAKSDKGSEIDTAASQLEVNGQAFPSFNGYCWVDMNALIQECERLINSDLQHGLVRWVQNYGEHVFRTLIQRSPKLSHHSPRRHSSSSTSSSGGTNGSAAKSHMKNELSLKPPWYRVEGGMLQPPMTAFRMPTPYQPLTSHSPTQNFYRNHLSLTGRGMLNTITQQGMMVPIPALLPTGPMSPQHMIPPQPHAGMVYMKQLGFHPSPGSPSTGILLPATPQADLGKEGGSAPVAAMEVGGGAADMVAKLNQMQMHATQPALQQFQQPPSQAPLATSFPEQQQMHQQHQQMVGVPLALSAGGHSLPAIVTTNSLQEHHHHQQLVQQQAAVAAATASLHQFTPQALPVLTAAVGERTEPLLPIPHVVSSVPPITAAASAPGHSPLLGADHRKEIQCRYFVVGQCPYGDKCWFGHAEPSGPPQVHSSIPTSPLHIQVPQPHLWGPNLPLEMAGGYVSSPPQSPLGVHFSSASPSGVRPPAMPHYPFPGQPPFLLWQPLSGHGRGARSFPLLPTYRPPLTIPPDPMLRFSLLAEVVVRCDELDRSIVKKITQLTTRADHFYVGFNNQVQVYKILFSGAHSYQDSGSLQECLPFPHRVTCVHCSRQQPFLLVVGTDAGQVFTCTLRKSSHYRHSSLSHIPLICTVEPAAPISSLVHFNTSLSQAQVIVVGTDTGIISWYISQPPQKTYSILFSDYQHSPHSVISLQVWGGLLVSGSSEGKLLVWSMRSQQPMVDSQQTAYSHSLRNIHVMDNSLILTIGRGLLQPRDNNISPSVPSTDHAPVGLLSPVTTPASVTSNGHLASSSSSSSCSSSSQDATGVGGSQAPAAINKIVQDMSKVSNPSTTIPSSSSSTSSFAATSQDAVILWQYGQPLKPAKVQRDLGEVVTTAFYQAYVGSMFLVVGLQGGTVKILNLPSFSTASELHFPEMVGKTCLHVALNLSRDIPLHNPSYHRNPFRDLILTTAWSDGKIMICQVARQ